MTADISHKALLKKLKVLEKEAAARKKAEAQLKKQSEFLNLVLESLSHPFYVVDANDYCIKLANSAASCPSVRRAKKSGTTGDTGINSRPTSGIIRKPNSATASARNAPRNSTRNIVTKYSKNKKQQTEINPERAPALFSDLPLP